MATESRSEFEKRWAESAGLSIEEAFKLGRASVTCHCEDVNCSGWQMSWVDFIQANSWYEHTTDEEVADALRNHNHVLNNPENKKETKP